MSRIKIPDLPGIGIQKVIPDISNSCLDLIIKMLNLNPSKRPSGREILKHPFINGTKKLKLKSQPSQKK